MAQTKQSDPTRRLKIGFFTYNLPQPGKSWGGVASVAHALANGLADRGHTVIVWCYLGAPEGARYEVRSLPGKAIFNHPLGRRLLMGYAGNLLAPFLKSADCDLYAFHGDSLLAPLLARPIVRIFHGSALDESRYSTSPVRRLSQRLIYELEKLSSVTGPTPVGVSETTQRRFSAIHDVIPNGVDLTLFTSAPQKKTAHPSLLFVGSFGGRKRGEMAVKTFETLKQKFTDLTLDFVGPLGGPVPDGVTIHCGVSEAELITLYQRAWLFLSPSLYEGFGLPYVEAMACGTPVVASPNPGSAEITANGQYGRLVDDGEWVNEIGKLLNDAGGREHLAKLGRERAKDFDLEKSLDSYESLFLGLAAAAKSWGRAGMSLVEVLVGASVAAIAALLIAQSLKFSAKATQGTMDRQSTQLEMKRLTAQLQRDFSRRQSNLLGVALQNSPQVFQATSSCQNLSIRQTILPGGTRTVEYSTQCTGAPLSAGASREDLFPELASQCAGRPVVRVRTTQPDGTSTQTEFPAPGTADAAVICFRLGSGGSSSLIQAEVLLAKAKGTDWKLTPEVLRLGLDVAGAGIEIIPPQ